MPVKTTIAIIGATGSKGAAIATSLSKGPYRLLLMASDPDALKALQQAIMQQGNASEVEIMPCAKDACWEADIIIAAVPYCAQKEIADAIREVATGKIVISMADPAEIPPGANATRELEQLLPHAKVVGAMHHRFAAGISEPATYKNADCLIAGKDAAALETVAEMLRVAGLNPLIADS